MRIAAAVLLSLALTGCSLEPTASPTPEHGLSIRGNVHGGQQPIVGAHVYLFAANTSGYGMPSVYTLSPTAAGAATDSIGTYVTSDANGAFTITGDYTCITGTQLYLYSLGGNPGAGNNTAAGLLAILGQCPTSGTLATTVPFVSINEVSTVAAAYAIAGFATDATHISSSGTPLAQTGIANAFANAANLANISTGAALTTTPAGNGAVPQAKINTLANILAACINSTGPSSTSCAALLSNTLSNGSTGTTPTDTATAAINIAHNPASNIAALFALDPATAPFAPTLSTQPKDFSILLTFTGGGLNDSCAIAIDQSGNVWITSADNNITKSRSVVELSPKGAVVSGATGYTDGNQSNTCSIAIDLSGSVWVSNPDTNSVTKFSASGSILSGTTGFTSSRTMLPNGIAIDALGNAWVENYEAGITKLSSSGAVLSGPYGYGNIDGLDYPRAIGIDGSGNAWVANGGRGSLTKMSSAGVPLSGPNGYSGGSLAALIALAIDSAGNVWVASSEASTSLPGGVTKFSNSGSVLLAAHGFDGAGGLTDTQGIAIDGAGNAWITNQFPTSGIIELSSAGALLSTPNGYQGISTGNGYDGILDFPVGIAVDGSGNVWVADQIGHVAELIGAAAPVITPIVAGLPQTPTTNGTSNLGTRP
jgi:hypothetical protein